MKRIKYIVASGLIMLLSLITPLETLAYYDKGNETLFDTNNTVSEDELSGVSINIAGFVSDNSLSYLDSDIINYTVIDEVIEITDMNDFSNMIQGCYLDAWSRNKLFVLKNDIVITDANYSGVPYFNGIFDGGGHKITVNRENPAASDYGLFRYVGSQGTVYNLNVVNDNVSSDTKENAGGICGVNYGNIVACTFSGRVSADDNVGGIVGHNADSGNVIGCINYATVTGTNKSGGIVGLNEGYVGGCTNEGMVNTDDVNVIYDIDGMIDLGSVNLVSNLVTRNDTGGIAGFSVGIICDSVNVADIGYIHVGYNVGGIVGRQTGIVSGCSNDGNVYGRKDVGGIVGQAEPFLEEDYLSEEIEKTGAQVDDLGNTINEMIYSSQNTIEDTSGYVSDLYQQYTDEKENVDSDIDKIIAGVSEDDIEAQRYVDSINNSRKRIDELNDQLLPNNPLNFSFSDTKNTMEAIESEYKNINTNLDNLQKLYDTSSNDAKEMAEDVSERINNNGNNSTKTVEAMIDAIEAGYAEMNAGIDSIMAQVQDINEDIDQNASVLLGKGDYFVDISDVEKSDDSNGVILYCKNNGYVEGDLNVGGIAGTMNIEYNGDPEYDVDVEETTDIALRTTVNCVLIHNTNYGSVHIKKSDGGGVVGQQEFGLLYDCEGYGYVKSESGTGIGGIAGYSAGTVQNSYSFCTLEAMSECGGICGYGYGIEGCLSLCNIKCDGNRVGAIAGYVNDEGVKAGNYFSSEELQGIDGISYFGIAQPLSYKELMDLENVPDGFSMVTVTFIADGEIFATVELPGGSFISNDDIPEAPYKEKCYAVWNINDKNVPLTENRIYEVEYVYVVESLGASVNDSGRNDMIVCGNFDEEDVLTMENVSYNGILENNEELICSYNWHLTGYIPDENEMECRVYVGENSGNLNVYVKKDGIWTKSEGYMEGSYFVVYAFPGCAIAITEIKINYIPYVVGGILIAVISIFVYIIIRKKKTKEKS